MTKHLTLADIVREGNCLFLLNSFSGRELKKDKETVGYSYKFSNLFSGRPYIVSITVETGKNDENIKRVKLDIDTSNIIKESEYYAKCIYKGIKSNGIPVGEYNKPILSIEYMIPDLSADRLKKDMYAVSEVLNKEEEIYLRNFD